MDKTVIMKKTRTTQCKGKEAEHLFFSMLLKKGFDVYTPLVDDNRIDALVRLGANKYVEIQIKSREADVKSPRGLADIKYTKGKSNYWFAIHTKHNNEPIWWLLSAKDFEKHATGGENDVWGITLNKDNPAHKRFILDEKRWEIFSQ